MPSTRERSGDLVLGADAGASKVSAARIAPDGRVTARGGRTFHGNLGPEAVLEDLTGALRRSLHGAARPRAIGVGVAGQVEARTGVVEYAPNLGWREFPLGARLSEEFGCPTVVANDVRAATVGEWRFGAGRGVRDLLCLFVGTGVGGSAVVDGRLLEGAANAFGEVGHSTLVAGGRDCRCPGRGCLEAYVGGWAIGERARERIRRTPSAGTALRRRAGSLEALRARTVGEAARAGDPLARDIMRETGVYLAAGVVGLVNAFNPALVLLGGGVVDGWPPLVAAVADRVRTDCQPPAARSVRVARAALGADAIPVGAAALARDRYPAARAASPASRRSAGRSRP